VYAEALLVLVNAHVDAGVRGAVEGRVEDGKAGWKRVRVRL
jgi:hypothetical protein